MAILFSILNKHNIDAAWSHTWIIIYVLLEYNFDQIPIGQKEPFFPSFLSENRWYFFI